MQIYTDLQVLGDAMWPFIFETHLGRKINQAEAFALIRSIATIKQVSIEEAQQNLEKQTYGDTVRNTG